MTKVKRFLFLKFDAKLSILEKIYITNNSWDKPAGSYAPESRLINEIQFYDPQFLESTYSEDQEINIEDNYRRSNISTL